MNPVDLFHKDGRPAGVVYCSECRVVYREEMRDLAESCCAPKICEDCKEPYDHKWFYGVCPTCWSARQDGKMQKVWDEARKVNAEDYDGGFYGHDGDAYADDIDTMLDALYDEHDEPPAKLPRVFGSKPVPFAIDAHAIISWALEEHHEDAYDRMSADAVNELQTFLDAWCQRNDPGSVEPDYDVAIVYEHLVDWPTKEHG